jgi:NADH:ubiquinone oxidoreductase subunit
MVWGLVRNFQKSVKYRGGWKGFLEHMYTNGDYPFKFGTFMGSDLAGNRYYENRVDYPFGQHRWVEPGDIHNFDSSSIGPEWHGWMTSMNDAPPCAEDDLIADKMSKVSQMCESNAPDNHNVGHQEKTWNFHNLHNQSQVRSRGYNIGNPIVGLPPNVKDSYYTQPGSPYNDASIRPLNFIGALDKDGGRKYKNQKWAERLKTEEEKQAIEAVKEDEVQSLFGGLKGLSAARGRGGTIVG